MDINNRKTALDDDSVLYQRRNETKNKDDVKNLDTKGKFQYFIDYYLMKVVVVLIAVAVGGNLIYSMVFRHQETLLTVMCIGEVYMEDTEPFAKDLKSLYQVTDKDTNVYISNYDLTDYTQQMAFSTHVAAGDADIILCDEEQFNRYAEQGLFADLTEVLDEETLKSLSENVVSGTVTEYDNEGNITSVSDEMPMVINVTGNEILDYYKTYGTTVYLGYCVNAQHPENAKLFIDYILGENLLIAEQE